MRHLVRQRWIHFMLHNLVWLIQFSHAKRKHQSPLGWIVAALVNIYECPVLYALGSQSGWQRDLGLFLPPQDHCMWAKVQLIIIWKNGFSLTTTFSILINRLFISSGCGTWTTCSDCFWPEHFKQHFCKYDSQHQGCFEWPIRCFCINSLYYYFVP